MPFSIKNFEKLGSTQTLYRTNLFDSISSIEFFLSLVQLLLELRDHLLKLFLNYRKFSFKNVFWVTNKNF